MSRRPRHRYTGDLPRGLPGLLKHPAPEGPAATAHSRTRRTRPTSARPNDLRSMSRSTRAGRGRQRRRNSAARVPSYSALRRSRYRAGPARGNAAQRRCRNVGSDGQDHGAAHGGVVRDAEDGAVEDERERRRGLGEGGHEQGRDGGVLEGSIQDEQRRHPGKAAPRLRPADSRPSPPERTRRRSAGRDPGRYRHGRRDQCPARRGQQVCGPGRGPARHVVPAAASPATAEVVAVLRKMASQAVVVAPIASESGGPYADGRTGSPGRVGSEPTVRAVSPRLPR